MDAAQLIGYLNARGIFPFLDQGKLKTRSREGIDADTAARIRAGREALTAFLAAQDDGVAACASDSIAPVANETEQPLSFNQERLWLTNQIGEGSAQYNLSQALRLSGHLQRAALALALDALVERHAALRTSYHERDGAAIQCVNPAAPLALPERDLRGMTREAQEAEVAAVAAQQAVQPFDLSSAPMLRVLLLTLADDEHVLVFTLHHIASDGWSMGILARDFATLYGTFSAGGPNPMQALGTRYIDYAAWQRGRLEGETLASELKFWHERLDGMPKLHGLPLDHARPAQQQFSGQRVVQTISPSAQRRLNQLAEAHGATFFMVMQAAFALLLSRWSGEDDIVIGCPVAGRTHRDLEQVIGFFANAVVYRTDLAGELSFVDLLARVKANAIEVFAHQEMPFETLAKSVQSERSLAYSPLFQVSLTLQNNAEAILDLPGLRVSNVEFDSNKTLFDLSLFVRESAAGLGLSWLFSDQLFERATIERIAGSFAVLLESIAETPNEDIRRLTMLSPADRALQLGRQARRGDDEGLCMHQLFERQAAQSPGAVALACDGETMTYAELNAEANKLARHLRMQGAGRDDVVGLCAERSVDMIIGLLGILKAGAAYMPLDPACPPARMAHMLDEAGVRIVVTQQALMSELPLDGVATVLVDSQWRRLLLAKLDGADLDGPATTPDGLAYVIFTSGSTGKPKGVMIEHAAFVQSVLSQRAAYGVDASSVVLQYVSFTFDVAAADWAMALTAGAALCIATEDERRDAGALAGLAAAWHATHMQLPAPVLARLDAAGFPSLDTIVVGGATASAAALAPWIATKRCFNAYGPTETAIASGAHRMHSAQENRNIGQPFPHVEYRVVDRRGQLLPRGVPGELLIGGYPVARGYCGRPELSAERFIDDPFRPGARLYRTGDLVRYLPGGELEFVGRTDDQVKLRGYRIELGEVRAALLALDDVREALVLVGGNEDNQRLLAYIVAAVPGADQAAFIAAVLQRLQRALPDYMVPSGFALLPALPLTPNGKVDTRALPPIAAPEQPSYLAPRNPTERMLCEIWQLLLKVERVGVHDNFFALGGDSILSIQVVSRANQAGLGITTRQLFAHQSVAELATQAGAAREQASQEAVGGSQVLLPIQRQFLGMSEHIAHFNQSVLLEAPADLDGAMLAAMMAALYERHDALRLRVARDDGGEWQGVYAPPSAGLADAAIVVEALPPDDRAAHVAARCAELQRGFDPSAGPLLRAMLLTSGDAGAARLFIVAHHMVVDGVSWRILLADLERAYRQLSAGKSVALGPKTSSYQAWGEAVARHAPQLASELAWWTDQLAQPVPALPGYRPLAGGAPRASTRGLPIALSAAATETLLKRCGQRYRTQVNELLLAAVSIALYDWRGAGGVRLMLEGHGREDLFEALDTSQTVGWFTTTYPLALACASRDTGAVIRQVKEQLRAVPNKGCGYGVLRYVAGEPALARLEHDNPAQLVFNYLGQFDQTVNAASALRAAPEPTGEAIDPRRLRHCPLGLNGKVAGGVLAFTLDYSALEFDRADMERLAHLVEASLEEVIAHCADAAPDLFTPSDFPLARTSAAELDSWQQRYRISRLYPATSMQQGMLFHSLLDSGAYVSQCCPVFDGELDPVLFRAAWNAIVARHDIFRTVFVGHGEQLHQLVCADAALPWREEDWRAYPAAEQAARFRQLVAEDRARGFDPACAPLQRIALLRLGQTRYRMLWSHHHMLLDGWCTPLVYRDVLEAYRQLLRGQEASIQRPARPYENYIGWLQAQDRDAARAFWREYLAPVEAPTPLGIAHGAQAGAAGQDEQRVEIDVVGTAALQRFARRHQTTVNTVLQLAWGYLLHRYSGEQHVLFGTTISGRPPEVEGVEEMVGLFINTVPVRVSFDTDMEVGAMLESMHTAFQSSTGHGHLPLTEIAQCSRIAGGSALFDSMFVFENYPLDAAAAADGERPPFHIEEYASFEETGYKLSLSASLRDTLVIKCRYPRRDFEPAMIARLLRHMEHVLQQLPQVGAIGALSLLLPEETQQLLAWNQSARDYPVDQCLHEMFETQACVRPQHTALVFEGSSLSYGELNQRANRVARRLVAQGVRPDTLVGVCVTRSLEMVAGILGILKAGAAYVPLDPNYPQARLDHILRDSAIGIVLTVGQDFGARLPADVDCIDIGTASCAPELAGDNLVPAALGLSPRNLAYVIYTSGSTGLPKGVMIEHAGLVNLIHHDIPLFEIEPQSRALHCASMSFDAGTAHLFMALCSGATTYLAAPDTDLVEAMQRHQITHAAFATSVLEAQRREHVPSLKTIIVGGDVCPKTTVEFWAARCRFFNIYGPTEATIASSAACLTPSSAITIGRPVANVELHVLDSRMRQVPPLVAGELYIGGAGLARAYLNRDDLTAERFVHGTGALAGKRLYRTGDTVRRLADGQLEFLGRADEQVKIRGFRIERGEIEARLLELDAVREAVVQVKGSGNDKYLLAYVVPLAAPAGPDAEGELVAELKESLGLVLPAFMVPAQFMVLEHFPLTANGKVDKAKLPEPAFAARGFVAARGATEQAVQAIWQSVLGHGPIGVHDNFFHIGGNSLQISRLVYELRSAFAVELSVKTLFASPTIAATAALVDALRATSADAVSGTPEYEEGIL
ncbi:amino acid adenylation domain-containing protein [Massilia forsythiae]|uniref:Amino acid adenylation domain-containing protein n=1 Tax=Massilia forsythiae TaxID=2728020 RepID=A0A7Z2ZUY4_9BURK|nr:non-ribosomal peptide synthetase [Massilia forsythiae]QJE01527.1 amino acid adenylation domain-containing protein [Massilia forsythiae]